MPDEPTTYPQDTMETKEPDFPELTRMRAFNRQQHIQKALEMGMTREEAERHADEDLTEYDQDLGGTSRVGKAGG